MVPNDALRHSEGIFVKNKKKIILQNSGRTRGSDSLVGHKTDKEERNSVLDLPSLSFTEQRKEMETHFLK